MTAIAHRGSSADAVVTDVTEAAHLQMLADSPGGIEVERIARAMTYLAGRAGIDHAETRRSFPCPPPPDGETR